MENEILWTGGISNRQIFLDTARSVTVWAAVSISLGLFFWLATTNIHFADQNLRAGLCAAFVGVAGRPIARWCRAHRS
jgi:hypothetical protein